MRRLARKITVITGAASGIGAATAELFANEGAVVAAVDVQDFSSPANENITTYRLDVSEEKDWSSVVSDIIGQHGRIDVLINNAGIGGLGQPVTEVSLEDWNRVIAVTQTGVLSTRPSSRWMAATLPRNKDPFPLADAADAHRLLENGATTGKVVLKP